MIESIKNLFRKEPEVNYAKLANEGAVILDVRSRSEFEAGHIKGSVNVSVDKLTDNLNKIPNKQKPVITCCASGMRSARAAGILKSNGYEKVYNGGGWASLQRKL
jgi:phage shock protein E